MFSLRVAGTERAIQGVYRHMSTARREALARASEHCITVEVCLNGVPMLVVLPNGTTLPPEGRRDPNCRRDSGQACFCANCRAGRR